MFPTTLAEMYIAIIQIVFDVQSDGKEGTFNLWSDNYPTVPYIAPGMIEGKEVVMDEWEVSNAFNTLILHASTVYSHKMLWLASLDAR